MRAIAEPKRHMSELIESQVTYSESGILLGLWHHFDLPEPALEIHRREMCGACHALQCFLYPWQQIGIILGMCIEPAEIYTEA